MLPLAIYGFSLSGAPAYWDTGEAQVVPWIFGIMHPTGFPTFTILAGIFAHVFAIGSVAWRISLFSALAMSGTAWLIWRTGIELEGDVWTSLASAWIFAFGEVAWTRGTRAEVHALAVFFAIAALCAAIRWYRTGESRALILGALAWGLGIATHPIVALLLPALLVIFIVRLRSVTPRVFALALIALLFGVAWYAYLPARSAAVTAARLDPTLALGIPPGRAFWDNDHPSTWKGFMEEVGGGQFGAGGTFPSMFSPHTYVKALPEYVPWLISEVTPVGVLFALGGLFALALRDGRLAGALGLAFAVPTAFAFAYTIEADPQRYYLIGFAVAAILAGAGGSAILRALPSLGRPTRTILLLLPLVLLFLNRGTFNQRNSAGAQAVIDLVIKKTPANAVLITPWIDATPLAYAAYVEHRLGNRIVESAWLADDASRVPSWMRTRPVYVVGMLFGSVPGYETVKVSKSPELYRVVRWPASSHSSSP